MNEGGFISSSEREGEPGEARWKGTRGEVECYRPCPSTSLRLVPLPEPSSGRN